MALLGSFGFADLMEMRSKLRSIFNEDEPETFEDAAGAVCRLFKQELQDDTGQPACALVRIYKTHLFRDLPDDLRTFAMALEPLADQLPALRCLTLVSSAGDVSEWNDRHASRRHKAIPLSSEEVVAQAPMVSQLITQLGLNVSHVLRPDPNLLIDTRDKAQGVFYVPQAAGSPYIVAQEDFVERYGIKSVLGFGGMMASGDLIAAILFSRVFIPEETADHFKVVGLNFKLALLPYARKPTFRP